MMEEATDSSSTSNEKSNNIEEENEHKIDNNFETTSPNNNDAVNENAKDIKKAKTFNQKVFSSDMGIITGYQNDNNNDAIVRPGAVRVSTSSSSTTTTMTCGLALNTSNIYMSPSRPVQSIGVVSSGNLNDELDNLTLVSSQQQQQQDPIVDAVLVTDHEQNINQSSSDNRNNTMMLVDAIPIPETTNESPNCFSLCCCCCYTSSSLSKSTKCHIIWAVAITSIAIVVTIGVSVTFQQQQQQQQRIINNNNNSSANPRLGILLTPTQEQATDGVLLRTGMANTSTFWDCNGGACGCGFDPLDDVDKPAYCHGNALFRAPTNNSWGATFYGTAAISHDLGGDWWLGEGCGKCWKLTGQRNVVDIQNDYFKATTTTIVVKGTNFCPPDKCPTTRFDIAAPGFMRHGPPTGCDEREINEDPDSFLTCSQWMIDDNDEQKINSCNCSVFNDVVLRRGCENYLSLGWNDVNVAFEELDECPPELKRLPCWQENNRMWPLNQPPDYCANPHGTL